MCIECDLWCRDRSAELNRRGIPKMLWLDMRLPIGCHDRCENFKPDNYYIVREDCEEEGNFFVFPENELADVLSADWENPQFYAVFPVKLLKVEYERFKEFEGF